MQNFGLSNFLSPLSKEEFLKSSWPDDYLFIPADSGKHQKFMKIPELQSLKALVAARFLKVRACLPDVGDECSSVHLDSEDALKAYLNDMTLIFDSMQIQNSTIQKVLNNLREDLGLVTGLVENDFCKARSIVYATPAGGETGLHFDANANFIIQLHGTKRWALAPNTSVENPTERFTAGATQMSRALESQCHEKLLYALPEESVELVMEPGCVLFVPRGYWHSTSTDEDSMSLNFTFSQPTWADLLTKTLQEKLLSSSDWRELADGVVDSSPERKQKALTRFEELVGKLALEFPEISGKQLLEDSGLLDT